MSSNILRKYNRVAPVRSNSVTEVPSAKKARKIYRQQSDNSIDTFKGRRASWNNVGGDAVVASLTSGSHGQSDMSVHDLRAQNQNLVSELNDRMKQLNPELTKPSFFSKRFLGQRQSWVFDSYGLLSVIIGGIVNATLFFTLVSSPLRLAFSVHESWHLDPFVDLVFFMNFLKNLFVTRISNGGENINSILGKFIRYYEEGNFFTDIICVLSESRNEPRWVYVTS